MLLLLTMLLLLSDEYGVAFCACFSSLRAIPVFHRLVVFFDEIALFFTFFEAFTVVLSAEMAFTVKHIVAVLPVSTLGAFAIVALTGRDETCVSFVTWIHSYPGA